MHQNITKFIEIHLVGVSVSTLINLVEDPGKVLQRTSAQVRNLLSRDGSAALCKTGEEQHEEQRTVCEFCKAVDENRAAAAAVGCLARARLEKLGVRARVRAIEILRILVLID